ncbi:uncharacterized protein LOC128393776 [Panonychus citri]|uniref:uncharacterized protein LOC128393776 n=1 Tax=Panonychus citri TaxID=50023 RepID=UPI0023079E08|nr:uncharacterized protein LOC128393776 [Panonychus citri]
MSAQRVADIESGLIDVKGRKSSSQSTNSSNGRNCCCDSLFQGIIFVICCFLFVSQSMMLIKVYYSFPTTISTNLTFDEMFDLPSVTLCFKSDLKPGSVEQATEVFKRNFNMDDKSSKDEDIKCNLMIPTINSVTGLSEVSPVACNEIVPTVESINFGLGKKCYTFFSKLGKSTRSSRELKVRAPRYYSPSDGGADGGNGLLTTKNGDLLTLEIEFGRKHIVDPLTISDDLGVSLSIHQSNELPLGTQKISKLKPGYNYLVTFDKIVEKRMPPPFRNGCDQYKSNNNNKEKVNQPANGGDSLESVKQSADDLEEIVSLHSHKSPRSKYDCVDQCLLTLYRETCNCLPSDINVRRDLLRATDTFCTNTKCQSLQIHRAEFCATLPRCKPNCEDEVYNFVTEVADSQSTSMVLSHYINSQKHRTASPSRPTNYNNGGGYIMGRPMIPNSQFQSYGLQEAGSYHGSLAESTSDIVNVLGSLSKAFVTVRKSSGPDVVYEHRPQYNYFDFIFQLMTLACVWLGFSVFSLLWKPFYIIFKIISFCLCLFTRNSRQTKPLINVD